VAGHLWSSLAFQRIRFNGGAPSAQAVVSETGPVSKEAGIRDKTYLNVQALLLRSFQPIRSAFLNAPTRATRSDRAALKNTHLNAQARSSDHIDQRIEPERLQRLVAVSRRTTWPPQGRSILAEEAGLFNHLRTREKAIGVRAGSNVGADFSRGQKMTENLC
jgi:hypothetical protein